MAKLIVLALAFTALVALASAHKTIVTTTTINDENNPISSKQEQQYCSPRLQQESFNDCQIYLQSKGQKSHPFERQGHQQEGQTQDQGLRERCCQELRNVDEQCQCAAVKKVLRDAVQTQQHQGGSLFGGQQIQRLREKAQRLPDKCNLQTRQQCRIGTISSSTTVMICADGIYDSRRFAPSGHGSQQCSQRIPQRFDQCQRFVEQALQSSSPRILMSINKQGHQQEQQQLQKLQQQCCNELENVQDECHCEALQKVYEQAIQQQQERQQPQQQQHGSQQGGQMQEQVQQVVQILKNQCNLQAEQCQIPSGWF